MSGLRSLARRLLPAVFLWMGCVALEARAQALLGGGSERIDLWPHVRVLADPARALSLEQALAARERFEAPRGAYATLGMEKEVAWLRVPLAIGAGGEGPWILDIDYALLQRVDVYLVRDARVVEHEILGSAQPYASQPLPGRSHAAALELPAGGEAELLLRVDTLGAKILPLTLSRMPAFHARALGEQLLQGALGCLGVFLLLFSLAQWVHLRESLYLKYALLVLCSTTFSLHFFGIGEMYLWTDRDWTGRHLAGVTSLMAAAATALFIEDVLAPDLNRWLRGGLRAVAAVNVLATVAHGFDLMDIQTVAIFMSTTGLVPALMGLPGALARARRGDSVGVWFMVAWVGYFIASAILVGVVRGRIGADFWTLHSFQIGATLDMLIFMRIALLRTAARHGEAQRAAAERDALFSLANSDPLTGLLNRRGLADVLDEALARVSPERILALYALDLDGFKPVNDKYGHDVGDALLRAVAQRLRASVRSGDGVARFGGDEFVVMAEKLPNAGRARELGAKLLEAFRSPFVVGQHVCAVGATIGYALAPKDGMAASELLKAADGAMYAGKQAGKDRLVPVD
jgi:diguanylate cyclase (GGDEF)-like protein